MICTVKNYTETHRQYVAYWHDLYVDAERERLAAEQATEALRQEMDPHWLEQACLAATRIDAAGGSFLA